VPEAAFPSDTKFTEVVQNALALLPESLIAHARRTSWLLNYAMFTGDEYPASWVTTLTGRGRPLKYPPPDGTSLVLSHQEQAFETIERRRYVWNMMTRVANWFGEDGLIRQNGAVARSVEVKTASPEPDGPVANYPGVESMPLLDRSDAQNFFSATGPTGLRRVIERLKSELPKEVTVDE
jgi:hypothetical protein